MPCDHAAQRRLLPVASSEERSASNVELVDVRLVYTFGKEFLDHRSVDTQSIDQFVDAHSSRVQHSA